MPKKKINFKVQTFCEISTFRFWLPVFLSCRLQNARNAVSDNQIPPPSPPQRDLRLRPRSVRLLVGWHLSVKKNLATGLETAKVRYIQSSCFARETLCCFLLPPPPHPPPPYNGVEYDMKNYAARGESYQRPKAEVDDKGSPREVEDR